MSFLPTAASEVVLRHSEQFTTRSVLFAGDLQDNLALQLITRATYAHCQYYHHWQRLQPQMGTNAQFDLLLSANTSSKVDTLLYFWPKNKAEARFQLAQLCSLLPIGCQLFIVGENRSGVRSAENLLAASSSLQKIDSARRCSFYHGILEQSGSFSLDDYWQEYRLTDIPLTIKTLPSVFSQQHLDPGSQLLISTFATINPAYRKIADVGCGSGVLACLLAKASPHPLELTLTDVNAAALAAAKATLATNQLTGTVIPSDNFSQLTDRFDLIITNPPFHDGIQKDIQMSQQLISQARQFLNKKGELRLVANAFLPYADLLDQAFGKHEVIAKNGRFKVYRAIAS